ncbi:MAG: general secretion pathway protein GspK [Synergistaceae bacterium]|nr:general secretion pathway protein GspK [Synergistaceae bacterium]
MSMKSGSRLYATNAGFILISVLLSVTLLLTAATAFAWYARNEMRRVESARFILQARSAADIACSIIAARIGEDKNGYDSYTELQYMPGGIIKIKLGDFDIGVNIRPLDDKIPIPGLFLPDGVTVRTEYESAWKRIWEYLNKPELGTIVLDFMDSDNRQKLGGSEREANIDRLVSDLTEFKLLTEMNNGILWGTDNNSGGLGMYVTVYGKEKININVAPAEVIAVLDERIGLERARNLVAARMLSPMRSLEDLRKVPGFSDAAVTKLANILGFESMFFRLSMRVSDGAKRERNYRIILQRSGSFCRIVRWEE